MGTDMQVEGIPSGKHQRDMQGPLQLCVCPPKAWNPAAISCTLAWKASYTDQEYICLILLSGLCFSQWILQGVSCRSCWQSLLARSKIRPEHQDLLASAWAEFCFCLALKKKIIFFPPTRGMGTGGKKREMKVKILTEWKILNITSVSKIETSVAVTQLGEFRLDCGWSVGSRWQAGLYVSKYTFHGTTGAKPGYKRELPPVLKTAFSEEFKEHLK